MEIENKEAGQTIIEAVFLIGISFLLLLGLVTSAIFSIKASRYSKNKAIATRVARGEIEAIKAAKQSAGFWEGGSPAINIPLDCLEIVVPSNFGCQYIYISRDTEGTKIQARLRIIAWWDSVDPPTDWWELEDQAITRKSNVILTTIISNWEQ